MCNRRRVRELEVTSSDAKRLLSQEKFELLEVCAEAQKTIGILPSLVPYYRQYIDELKQLKFEEITRNKFVEYEHSLTIDEERLKQTVNNISLTTRQEACHFVQERYPKFKKLLDTFDPINWVPQHQSKIISATKEFSEIYFEYGIMEMAKHPKAFMYKGKSWIFIIPHTDYIKNELHSLEFSFKPYAVYTFVIHRAEHTKIINGYNSTYPASEKVLMHHTEILDSNSLEIDIPHIIIPWKLIRGLANGKIQTEGCEVTLNKKQVITYHIEGYENNVVLSHNFLKFFKELGNEPKQTLRDLYLIDDISYQIIETIDDTASIKPPMIREKDRNYLGIIHKSEGFLTYEGWGNVLGLTRNGAYRTLNRLGNSKLVTVMKHESGEGIKAILTQLGLSAIR